ncbi:Rhodanese-like domain-containing protein 15 [Citrus sinensis]|uniref:Rhodanese-like domain-containing protein 15 n=3 Tax=Citrus TaxID=2706 RepID=A0ACB8IZK8_CITSI|nr:thiosulfate sulfurtransferase 16, chloroplastic isoform X1 [Citrus x clementina]XP_052300209.1 thiosulfate sulfurtransferase 16, chloroplastic-like [Citrus sinensis]ESR38577.1 hypothetical protein CICLE_v10026577mg [Citrus x clementina]KAH9662495.1 Rhodanese-like domain-containing protein 15 [Citrus sinensis]KAH9710736.1 Rhodanese-like domain-containing protein 15 [Citrus sinensis]KDO71379.1 hypothetical protein CISIN_1g029759mg [Citrus sinensis]
MEATSLISLSSFAAGASSLPPVLCPHGNNRRGLLSLTVDQQRCDNIGFISSKILSFCPKASLRGNLEAVGVPTSVPVRVAHELLQAGHRYLDVRTPEEFSAGHATGAINVPYMYRVGSGMTKNLKFVEEVSTRFRKHDEIIVGCQSGKRSMMAATDLLNAGFAGITDIAGGFAAWRQNGLPTEP